MNNWMADIADNRKMNSIILPGSHDAGMVDSLTTPFGLATKDNTVTQRLSIRGQLNAGIRWLDIRIDKSERCFHNFALGQPQIDVARDIVAFLHDNPNEVVIVLLTKSAVTAYPLFLRTLSDASNAPTNINKAKNKLYGFEASQQIAGMTLGALRGRVVVAMDKAPVMNELISHQVIRTLLNKYDATEDFNGATDEKSFVFEESVTNVKGKYYFVLNSAGSFAEDNNADTIRTRQLSRAAKIRTIPLQSRANFMPVYYTTNTVPHGVRTTSIEKQDKMWRDKHFTFWKTTAIRRGVPDATKPLFNCVIMDFVSEERCQKVRDAATSGGLDF